LNFPSFWNKFIRDIWNISIPRFNNVSLNAKTSFQRFKSDIKYYQRKIETNNYQNLKNDTFKNSYKQNGSGFDAVLFCGV
jgi:hypothetical protein